MPYFLTNFIPKSLNNIGSYVLELEKFWVLWIEIIKKELKLATLINLTNVAISYLSNDKLIKQIFNNTINFLKINKKEINEFCNINKIKSNNFNFNHAGEYDYLLDKLDKIKKSILQSDKKMKMSPYFGNLKNSKIKVNINENFKENINENNNLLTLQYKVAPG